VNAPRYIRWFDEIGAADVALVGGKNASLGEMVRELSAQGVRVPDGFAVTAQACRLVLDRADAWPRLTARSTAWTRATWPTSRAAPAWRARSSTAPPCRPSWRPRSEPPTRGCAPSTART
jgi:hypothetical protein